MYLCTNLRIYESHSMLPLTSVQCTHMFFVSDLESMFGYRKEVHSKQKRSDQSSPGCEPRKADEMTKEMM